MIEYAAFYGSIQIFQYLLTNGIKLNPSLWNYAVHGCNGEIIHILEENKIEPLYKKYEDVLIKSIEFHHNDTVNYIINNYFENKDDISNILLKQGIKYHNFMIIDSKLLDKSCFYYLCESDYPDLVDILIKTTDIDINYKERIEEENDEEKNDKEENDEYSEKHKMHIYTEKTPLFVAIENNNIEIIKILILHEKLDINLKSKYSKSFWLEDNDDLYVGDDSDEDDDFDGFYHESESEKTALFIAIEQNSEEFLKLLLSHKNIDVNEKSKFMDKSKIEKSKYETTQITEKTALYFAIERRNSKFVELLLANANIDVNIPYIFKKERNNDQKLKQNKKDFHDGKTHYFFWKSNKYNYSKMNI